MENPIEVQEVNTDITIKLSEGTFTVLNEAISKNNHFQTEAQKSLKELNDNLTITLDLLGYDPLEYTAKGVNFDTKELVLTKKTESL